ncbi:MAG: AAA family ATPase, partial [Myxococcales bacterium]|nr:AAA family ATPase [Myxococcales bacterium]
ERAMATVMLVRFAAYDETPDSAVRSLIRRFGGTVSRRMIDGSDRLVAAVFGVGETTGRDAEAAARCALRIARLAESSASRVGEPSSRSVIHSTTLLLETDGKPIDAAVDAELSHAQELLQRARPGDVVASKHAERALRPFFHVELVDDGPVPLSRVLGERTVTEAFGRFVGRKEELKRIGEIFALANRGKRRTLLIHGDAGVGKSRLLHETIRRLRLGKHPVGMHLVSIPRDHVDVPLSGIREMLRTILGVDEFDPEPIIRRKVARLRELGLQPLEIRSVEANLGLRSESPERRSLGTLRSALANIARKLAEDTLTVLAFDGADHLDDESRTLIRHLVDDVRQSRLVVILTYRRPVRAPWEGVSRFYDFEVGPLSEEDLEELLTARFRTDGIERALVELVHRVTQANPRHAEEYVRALIERNAVLPVDDLARLAPDVDPKSVPSELRDLLRARLTAVDAADRRVLEMAALAGARSTAPVIAHALREDVTVVTRSLSLLEQLGVLVRRGASEYAVVGDLVGDLVLENVPEPTRREGHAALAEALEQLYPSRLEEFAERLAEHYRSGGSLEKSVNHWIRSADRLEAEGALDSAIGSVSRAIEILRELPSYDRELFLGLHARLGELSIRARATVLGISAVLRALDEAENVGRDDYFARYAMQLGRLHVLKHDYQRSREWLERARQSARNIGNRELLREVTLASAEANVRNGRFGEGVDLLEAALSLSRDTGNVQSQLRCLLTLAATYAAKGDKERALKVLEEAESILGVHPDRTTELEALTVESTIHFLSRNYTEALEAASRALELSKEYGLHDESAGVAYQVGLCQLHLGQFKAAFASFQSSQELARAHGQQKTEMASLRGLGFVDAFHFRNEGGRAQLEQALRFAEEQGYEGDVLEGKLMLALVDEHFGRKKDARRVLDEVLSLALLQGNARVRDDAESAIAALDAGTSIPFPV